MKKRIQIILSLSVAGTTLLAACQKDFLKERTNQSLIVPTTVTDLQGLLDNNTIMNSSPFLPVVSGDEYYVSNAYYQTAAAILKNAYTWNANIFDGTASADWNNNYKQVFYSNVVLDKLNERGTTLTAEEKNVKGAALFFRALGHFQLAQTFCKPYLLTAASDPGIPVRLSADVNIISVRGSVAQTYASIVSDLREAVDLLPAQVTYKTRPAKRAALALISRVYLMMQRYEDAYEAANAALTLSGELLDYNKVTANLASATNPFPRVLPNGNEEVIFHSQVASVPILGSTVAAIDTNLYRSYAVNDLRPAVLFVRRANGTINFKGSYSGSGLSTIFSGLANDELYLTRAECLARKGELPAALADLNALLVRRWKTGTFVAVTAANADEALLKILNERKKELLFRNIRWSDLRRLNTETRSQNTLVRNLNGNISQLLPNADRYVFPIPDNEISSNGLAQNPR